jgi:ketosteroid isomerase-like protein
LGKKSNHEIVLQFVECINRHDLDGIAELMTTDHSFIDSLGEVYRGRDTMYDGWKNYFKMVPDYRIEVSRTLVDGVEVVLLGVAGGTYAPKGRFDPQNRWSTPAAWRAVIRDEKVAEWQVYADNEPVRRCMRDTDDDS